MEGQPFTKMSVPECAGRAFGMAIGNLFLGFFGMLWILLGLVYSGHANAAVLTLLSCFVAALFAASIYTMRRTFRLFRADGNAARRKVINRKFGRINGIQWGVIIAVCLVLSYSGLAIWILPAIILIVGIHFFPLARLFHNRVHYITGAAMVAWAMIYPIAFSPGKGDPIGAIGTGVLLWASAAWMCWRALRLLRRVPGSSSGRGTVPNGAPAG